MELPAAALGTEDSPSVSPAVSPKTRQLLRECEDANVNRAIRTFDLKQIEKAAKALAKQRDMLRQLMKEGQDREGREKVKQRLHGHLRKAVTGDSATRVRDHLLDRSQDPLIVRLLDKVAFTFGVLNIVVTEAVLLLRPEKFWIWYTVIIPTLIAVRYPYYKRRKWHYFLLDFCYWVHLFSMVQLYVYPESCYGIKLAFLYGNGPLAFAIPSWRNSLVFHDMEKTSSVYIHLFPALLSLSTRWFATPAHVVDSCGSISAPDFGVALLVYIGWQALYFVKTEIVDKPILLADPALQTSLRWLTTDQKNALHKGVLALSRKLKIMKRDEKFDPTKLKTKAIFMSTQLLFTVATMLAAVALYTHYVAHAVFLLAIFGCAVWNGSNFYIEVFARRYWSDLEKRGTLLQERKLLRQTLADTHTGTHRDSTDSLLSVNSNSSSSSFSSSPHLLAALSSGSSGDIDGSSSSSNIGSSSEPPSKDAVDALIAQLRPSLEPVPEPEEEDSTEQLQSSNEHKEH